MRREVNDESSDDQAVKAEVRSLLHFTFSALGYSVDLGR